MHVVGKKTALTWKKIYSGRLGPCDSIEMMHSHGLAANAPRLLLAEVKRSKGKPESQESVPKPKAEPKNTPKAKPKPKGSKATPKVGDQ